MPGKFQIGDHVSWNSEAGRVSGTIRRKISAPMMFMAMKEKATGRPMNKSSMEPPRSSTDAICQEI